jgi:dihydrofolate synthase/folylpolyglutamate synthase
VTRRSLADWLDYQQRVHPRSIELGLERVRAVWLRMGAAQPASIVIAVGGTNGKGSTVAFLEAMLAAAGKRVGSYTSPHLLRYNERVRVLGAEATDAALIDAFERIEAARTADSRQDVPLTYFEFGTLAALWICSQSVLDVALLEVGLGGRLDAVNIVDADAGVVTTVDLDHQDWLGADRDSIGREKAGIFRSGRPAIIGMREPPAGLLAEAERIGASTVRSGRDFHIARGVDVWRWQSGETFVDIPDPALAAPCQIDNAATAIATLHALCGRLPWMPGAIVDGVRGARLAARLQRLQKPGATELVIDVAHNPQAAQVLAQWLQRNPSRAHTFAVFGALSDKDVASIMVPLVPRIERWFVGSLADDSPRGLTLVQLRQRMPEAGPVSEHADIASALDAAAAAAQAHDRIIAFGSFFVAAAALRWGACNGYRDAYA